MRIDMRSTQDKNLLRYLKYVKSALKDFKLMNNTNTTVEAVRDQLHFKYNKYGYEFTIKEN